MTYKNYLDKVSTPKKLAIIFFIIIVIATVIITVIRLNNQNLDTKSNAAVTNSFVTRSGNKLILNGQQFRFAGTNIYWLGLDENIGGVAYPTHQRIDDVFTSASAMNTTVVRATTLGVSTGCSLCLEPSLNNFNDKAFDTIDYAISNAYNHGIKLIIPLTDQWNFYHGGKHNFTEWRGISNTDQFHHDTAVINDFKTYISYLLNHKNPYRNNIALKDDPTIMAWETGNELYTQGGNGQTGTQAWSESWTDDIAQYIKSLAPNQLVADGRVGNSEGSHILSQSLNNSHIDMMSDHLYPPQAAHNITNDNNDTVNMTDQDYDAQRVTSAKKVFFIGEFDWTNSNKNGKGVGQPLQDVLNNFTANKNIAGDLYWSLFPAYEGHGDGYTLHYPGDDDNMKLRVGELSGHATNITLTNSTTATPTIPVTATPTTIFTPTTTAPPSQFQTGNILGNGSFEDSSSKAWVFQTQGSASGKMTLDTSTSIDGKTSAKIDVSSSTPSTKYYVQMRQENINIVAGHTYNISFYAKAQSPRDIQFFIQRGVSPYTEYFSKTISLGNQWVQTGLSFIAPSSDSTTLFDFNFAETNIPVWIDNVFVRDVSNTPTPVITTTLPVTKTTIPVSTTTKPTPTAAPAESPYKGTAFQIPGIIQAEDFDNGGQNVAYYDSDASNNGGAYRSSGVDIQANSAGVPGYSVGWTKAGEWMKYTINVTTDDTYYIASRVASGIGNSTFHIEIDNQNVTGTITVPKTKDVYTYQNVVKDGIHLTKGLHYLTLYMDKNDTQNTGVANFDYISIFQ